MTRILLVEDDVDLARGLEFNLRREGYEVLAVTEGHAALAAADQAVDLVILDLGLPDLDGTEVLKALRRGGSPLPVICLTSRGTEADVVMGFGLGADDYVTKPFGLAELLARIAAVLRRSAATPETLAPEPDRLMLDPVTVDFAARTVSGPRDDQELTPTEVDLLRYLVARRGCAVDREELLKQVWGLDSRVPTRTLDNHVARLRRNGTQIHAWGPCVLSRENLGAPRMACRRSIGTAEGGRYP